MMPQCVGRAGFASLVALALLAGAPCPAAEAASNRLIVADDGTVAFILRDVGAIDRVDMATVQVETIVSEKDPPVTAIAVAGSSSSLFGLVPAGDGRSTLLRWIDPETGASLKEQRLRVQGRLLQVTSGAETALVAGLKPGAHDTRPERWILVSIEVGSGSVSRPLEIGMEPLAMAVHSRGSSPRLFVAGADRVATFDLWPLRRSRFYTSPGVNREIVVPPSGSAIFLLRDGTLTIIDPQRRARRDGRVVLSDDDATAVIPLPSPGRALALSRDAATAAVLLADGRSVASIDVRRFDLIETVSLPVPHDLIAPRILPDEAGGRALLARAAAAGTAPIERIVPTAHVEEASETSLAAQTPSPDPIPEPPSPAVTAPVPSPPDTTGPEESPISRAGEEPAEPPAAVDAPAEPAVGVDAAGKGSIGTNEAASEPGDEAPAGPPPATVITGGPEAEAGQAGEGDGRAGRKAGPRDAGDRRDPDASEGPPAASGPRHETRAHPALTGRITGETSAAKEVLIYGPNNIVKLHARARIAADGSFRLPLPAPGRYRLVVSGGPDVHLFTRPEYRMILITREDEGMGDLDFEVRGRL